MADPMKIRASVVGDSTEVKVLMSHEMETGQRKDAAGKTVPAWFIQSVTVNAQRQARAQCAVGSGDFEESVPVVQVQGRREGRQGPDHLGRQQGRKADRRSGHRLSSGWRGGTAPARADEARDDAPTTRVPRYRRSLEEEIHALHSSWRPAGRRIGPGACCPRRARPGQHGGRDREVPRRAAGRQSGRALGGARRRSLDAEARPEERVARAVRPRPRRRRRQGRVRAAAEIFRRCRPRDGPGNADRLVHGDAAGLHRGRRARRGRSAVPTGSPTWRPTSPT